MLLAVLATVSSLATPRGECLVACRDSLAINIGLSAGQLIPDPKLLQVPRLAPKISGNLVQGPRFVLDTLRREGPVIVYFTSTGCPMAAKANPYFNRIAVAFKGTKVSFLAVVNADRAATKVWLAERKLNFPAFADGGYRVIRAYGIKIAPTVLVIDQKGLIVEQKSAWSRSILESLTQRAAGLAKIPVPTVDLRGAPAESESG